MLTGAPGQAAHRRPPEASQPGRWELLRALGALVADPPARTALVAGALGLSPWSAAEHTELFVLSLPPFASVHLSADGTLGGEAADRVAGIWRVLGLTPPADPDHLGVILALYAELGQAAHSARAAGTRERLDRAREAVLWEHLWPWLPGYLTAVTAESPAARPWALLTGSAVRAEARCSRPAATLPLALRTAPEPVGDAGGDQRLPQALTARMRTGCVLTYGAIAAGARQLGLGLRRGERAFALKAMLEQDPGRTLGWLAGQATAWAGWHRQHAAVEPAVARWWVTRSLHAARSLRCLAAGAAPSSR